MVMAKRIAAAVISFLENDALFESVMDKVFRMFFLLLGMASITAGAISGMGHCYMIGAMCIIMWRVMYKEDKK